MHTIHPSVLTGLAANGEGVEVVVEGLESHRSIDFEKLEWVVSSELPISLKCIGIHIYYVINYIP